MTSSILIVLVMLVRRLCFDRLPKTIFFWAWVILSVSLVIPIFTMLSLPVEYIIYKGAEKQVEIGVESYFSGYSYVGPGEEAVNSGSFEAFIRFLPASAVGLLYGVWIIGVAVSAIRLIKSNLAMTGSLKKYLIEADPRVKAWVEANGPKLRRPSVYVLKKLKSPFTYGVLRPRIIISEEDQKLPDSQLSCLLLHEMTHIKRLDVLTKYILAAAMCIHWYNPLVRWAYKVSMQDIEYSCDEAVLRKLPSMKKTYAELLVTKLEQSCNQAVARFSDCLVASRVASIVNGKRLSRRSFTVCLVMVLLFAFAAISISLWLNTFSFPEKRIAVESEIEKWSPAYSEQLKDFSSFGYKLTGDELTGLSKRDFEAWEYSACNADEDSPMLEYSKAQMLCVDGRTVICDDTGKPFKLTFGTNDSLFVRVLVDRENSSDARLKVSLLFPESGETVCLLRGYTVDDSGMSGASYNCEESAEFYLVLESEGPVYVKMVELNSFFRAATVYVGEGDIFSHGISPYETLECCIELEAGTSIKTKGKLDISDMVNSSWSINLILLHEKGKDVKDIPVDYVFGRDGSAEGEFVAPVTGSYKLTFTYQLALPYEIHSFDVYWEDSELSLI